MPATKKTRGAGGKAGGNALEGVTFAISGPLSKPRKHWEDLITSQGGTLATSVTAAVQYLLTTEGEIAADSTKIQTARVKSVPMLSEEVVTDAVSSGEFPDDLSDYLLKGSPPLRGKRGAKKATGAKAAASAPARAKKTRATLEEADAEDEEEEAKPARGGKKASAAKKVTAAKKAAAKEEEDGDEEEASKPAKAAGKKATTAKRASKATAAKEEEDEEEEEAKSGRTKAKAAGKKATAAKRGSKATTAKEEEEEEKKEEAPKATAKAAASGSAMEVDEKPATTTAPTTTTAAAAAATTTTSSSTSAPPALERAATTLDMSDKKSEVVFSFDTTGSMYPCLTQVRRKINECVERLFKEIGADNLRIGITAHGDYCDAGRTYVTKHLPLTHDIKKIVTFVETVEATGGGDAPECYELVLHEALSFPWTPGWNHVLVLIGDELPHEANANPSKLDWKTELGKLKDAGVQVHGVQALNRKHATKFYATCANMTGGVHLPLDQFNAIVDLVMAVCYREARPGKLEVFEKEVQAGGRYNRSIQTMFDRMLGRGASTAVAPGDMNAVAAGRFQVLDVDNDISIKDFVLSQGVTFQTGRGFYEFNKPETIQDYKEIILMDPKTGDMFEGDYARTLINAPKGNKAVKVRPNDIDFIVFVQSTSHNRKLIGGTRFLYEVEEK